MIQDRDPVTHHDAPPDSAAPRSCAGTLSHAWRAAILNAAPYQAVLESCTLIAVTLVLLVISSARYDDSQRFLLGCFGLGELAALLLALRLRQPQATRWRQIASELTVAGLSAGSLSVLFSLTMLIMLRRHAPANPLPSMITAGAALPILHGLTYLILRAGMRGLRWWSRLRRRRLLWTLTHDQLVVVLAVGSIAGICALGVALASGTLHESLAGDALGQQALSLSLIGALYLGLSAALLIAALPLAVLLSYVLVRRIVQRVELLAQATDAVRQGNYATQVAVVGQDEIARLQTNFNAMAAELDRTLRELQVERDRTAGLLQAQRELVASVSHELRTPVATQRAYLDTILRQKADLPPNIAADLIVVERETQRLQRLIDDLFTLARAEVGRLTLTAQPLDLGTIAERVVAMLAPLAWRSRRIELAAQIPAEPSLALVDEGRFEQILRNLIHNALRHTPPGGMIMVAVIAEHTTIRVDVHDTGSGIAPDDLPQIWNRFYRADNARTLDQSGVGLGLALVKELSEAMGGSVAVTSILGTGSSFTIRLPRITASAAHPAPRSE
ncbi:MAG: HAMP domain-containing histidine kinase [Chloroflexi bacterium]|nr:HAMP domain-containing histidine kinase [Chloroflexota bacterium]